MATRNFRYDHPAYLVPVVLSGAAVAGANSNVRFVAHADMLAKQLTSRCIVAGSSASQTPIAYKVSGTTTTALGTATLVGTTANAYTTVLLSNAAIAAGDEIRILNGTDATMVNAHAIEAVVTPGANFTV
jgi:hypothetical protein